MRFFKVASIVDNQYVATYHMQIEAALERVSNLAKRGSIGDLLVEECLSFGPDMHIPAHSYDCHYLPLYVVKAGLDHDRVHYSFHVSHLRDILEGLMQDQIGNVHIETTMVDHWNKYAPKEPEVTTLGQLLRDRLAKTEDGPWEVSVVRFMEENQKVSAIKAVREATKLGLKEAKDVIDELMDYKYRHCDELSEKQWKVIYDIRKYMNGKMYI